MKSAFTSIFIAIVVTLRKAHLGGLF